LWDYTKALIERKVGKKGKEKDAIDKTEIIKKGASMFFKFQSFCKNAHQNMAKIEAA